jgi:polyisoprenoid-binding protein YceI
LRQAHLGGAADQADESEGDTMSTETTTTTMERAGQASSWQLDVAHTQIWFSVRHMMFATVKGQFGAFAGEIVVDETDPTRTRVSVEIDTASIDTRNEQRDGHLRSADFFDVENFPKLTFVSRRVDRSGDRLEITGDLTIRGVMREVVLRAEETGRGKDPWGQEKIGFTAETKIDRKDFGLVWNQALETGGVLVSDEVRISIDGQATRS